MLKLYRLMEPGQGYGFCLLTGLKQSGNRPRASLDRADSGRVKWGCVFFKQGATCLSAAHLCYQQPGGGREKPARALQKQLSLQLGKPTRAFRGSRDHPPFVWALRVCIETSFQRNLVHQGIQAPSRRRNLHWGHHSAFLFPSSLLSPTQRASRTHSQVRKDLRGIQGTWTWVLGGWSLVEKGSDLAHRSVHIRLLLRF